MDQMHAATENNAAPRPATDPGTSDHAIVRRVVAGNREAFELVMRRYNQRLYRIARGILGHDAAAEDAVQDAYVKAYLNLPSYRPTGSFSAWLSRITVNEALMAKRKALREPIDTSDGIDDLAGPGRFEPTELLSNRQLGNLLEKAIDGLPDPFRAVFVLRAVEQLSVAETASSLDIPPATVKTRYHRARTMIRSALEREFAAAGTHAFEFAGARCDRLCARVLERIGAGTAACGSAAMAFPAHRTAAPAP